MGRYRLEYDDDEINVVHPIQFVDLRLRGAARKAFSQLCYEQNSRMEVTDYIEDLSVYERFFKLIDVKNDKEYKFHGRVVKIDNPHTYELPNGQVVNNTHDLKVESVE